MSLGDVNLACAWALVEELVRGGMVHACVSPGSRSTPLALALERHPAITTHVHLDERSSAFFALGIAKATGRPVGVACTSGTAAAELFPAVVEASQARVPLVLLTADRPPRLRGTGANQTIDQVELYGRYARAWLEPPVPSSLGDASRWAEAGRAAIEAARGSPAGPVQVNCPFEEPLVPEGKWKPQVEASAPGPIGGTGAAFPEISLPDVIGALTSSDHGLVVVGSIPRASAGVLEVAERLGWPVLAEPTSNLRLPGRALAAGQALVSSAPWMDTMAPEVVVQLGAAPTTRATQALVSRADRLVVVDDHHPEPDPEGRATARVRLGPIFFANAVLRELPPPPPAASEWQAAWLAADARARAAVDRLLDRWDEPYEGRIARDLAAAIPDGGTLVVGSSMPIRDLDHYMSPREGLRGLANRGASGIHGVVSTALGVA
ncbi:MAG: 2-succinyl-5-enolpyruvyl-6-hydroxy-3-cyclohexene-1-carboxylic-acid synthase, partial [Actinobacteria bacterium]|nr:2-succinyl-5-enolpyruvyl-6-hydroxy-3-cyclohexene-1-carboxylic-acid synthase [Actinomycetota bacterium]